MGKQTNTTSQNYHQFNSLLTICPEQYSPNPDLRTTTISVPDLTFLFCAQISFTTDSQIHLPQSFLRQEHLQNRQTSCEYLTALSTLLSSNILLHTRNHGSSRPTDAYRCLDPS